MTIAPGFDHIPGDRSRPSYLCDDDISLFGIRHKILIRVYQGDCTALFKSIMVTGLPISMDQPTTTACFPLKSTLMFSSIFMQALAVTPDSTHPRSLNSPSSWMEGIISFPEE